MKNRGFSAILKERDNSKDEFLNNELTKKLDKMIDKIYIAKPKIVTNVYWNGFTDTTDEVEMFLVEPMYEKKVFKKPRVIGYTEVVTGKKVIKREHFINDFDVPTFIDKSIDTSKDVSVGDLEWTVSYLPAKYLIDNATIFNYARKSHDEIEALFNNVKSKAKSIKNNYKIEDVTLTLKQEI